MDQPHNYLSDDQYCTSCNESSSNPLPKLQKAQLKVEFESVQANANKFRAQLDQQNRPEEEALCSIPSECLTLEQARRLQVLHGNLEKVLRFYLQSPPHDSFDFRRERLENAILEVPLQIVNQFSGEELFTQAEILQEAYSRNIEVRVHRCPIIGFRH
jgi:hypothetical protein